MKALKIYLLTITALCIRSVVSADREPILQCNFDDGLCEGWENEEDELFRWVVKKGPAKDTGPKYDYTRKDQRFLQEEVFLARSEFSMAIAGNLIDKYPSSSKWDITLSKFYSEQPFDKVYLRIQALKGRRENNVVAIDDFSITPGRCPKGQISKTATRAPPMFNTPAPTGAASQAGESRLTNEEIAERNAELSRINEERNRKLQEMNNRLNSGQPLTTNPTQATQSQSGISEAEKQRRFQEEQRRLQAEAEKRMREETERLAKEAQEKKAAAEAERKRIAQIEAERVARLEAEQKAKEVREKQAEMEKRRLAEAEAERIKKQEADRLAKKALEQRTAEERRRKDLLEQQRKQREERIRMRRERREKQRLERLRLQQLEDAKRKLETDKRRERLEREKRLKEERERRLKEEEELKRREDLEKQKRLREEEKKREKEREDRDKNLNQQGGDQGKDKIQGKRRNTKANNPNYEKCGDGYSHKAKQVCCNGVRRAKVDEFTFCCGKRNYNTNRKFCCGDKLTRIEPSMSCCGGDAVYNVTTQGCCDAEVYALPNQECIDDVIQPISI